MPCARDPRSLECTWRLERHFHRLGLTYVAGCDEAGRGSLIGPLFAAAVILDPGRPIRGINDSKKLTARRREQLAAEIQAQSVGWRVVSLSAEEVDLLNVFQASRAGMILALQKLIPAPQFILTDAMRLWDNSQAPNALAPFRWLVHGDARSVSIAAASILAKVARDEVMCEMDRHYPQYNLARNKGYGTPDHLKSLRLFGPCPEHRRTFQPVKELCQARLPMF